MTDSLIAYKSGQIFSEIMWADIAFNTSHGFALDLKQKFKSIGSIKSSFEQML